MTLCSKKPIYPSMSSKPSKFITPFPHLLIRSGACLHPADRPVNLDRLGLDAAQELGVAARELVHGREGEVEAADARVDGDDVDRVALVGELPAGAALLGC